MRTIKYENIIFYLDITGTSKSIKRKEISKALEKFIIEKKKVNPLTVFGLLIFKEGGRPDFLADINDQELILSKISDEWSARDMKESFLENGLFFCLSHVANQAAHQSGDYRVVVISDFPSNKSEDYQTALFELVSKVRFMPTFIDIIRIGGERFYSDDVKLRVITTTASGGLFYAQDSKSLTNILQALTKNKRFASLNQPSGNIYIDEENKDFYENLAAELLTPEPGEFGVCSLCENEICQDCNNEYSRLLKCTCGVYFHEEHIGKYSFENNIGLPHIFRCPECDGLLRMDESRVLKINGIAPKPTLSEILQKQNEVDFISDEDMQEENLMETEASEETLLNPPEDLHEIPKIILEPVENTANNNNSQSIPLTPSGYGFFQKPISRNYNNKQLDEKMEKIEEINDIPSPSQKKQKPAEQSVFGLTPPTSELGSRKQRSIRKFVLCTICGTSNSAYDKTNKCKNCGAPI